MKSQPVRLSLLGSGSMIETLRPDHTATIALEVRLFFYPIIRSWELDLHTVELQIFLLLYAHLASITYTSMGSRSQPKLQDIWAEMSIKQCCGLGRCVVTKGLQDCSGCKAISYCGREHQVEHYKDGHKLVCPGREKPLSFASCVEKATRYYNGKMWVAALPYYSALLVSSLYHNQFHQLLFDRFPNRSLLNLLPCRSWLREAMVCQVLSVLLMPRPLLLLFSGRSLSRDSLLTFHHYYYPTCRYFSPTDYLSIGRNG
jgi:MYND finger